MERSLRDRIIALAEEARRAQRALSAKSHGERMAGIEAIGDKLREKWPQVVAANELDMEAGRALGLSEALLDRLYLDRERIEAIAGASEVLLHQPDPVGQVVEGSTLEEGMGLLKKTVPMGVLGMIYEARPNVTVDAVALALKSGNGILLRGGKEALNSNRALVALMKEALTEVDLDPGLIGFIDDTTHDSSNILMGLKGHVDVLIPRGSGRLISAVTQNATVPTIETGVGNCHLYVDAKADVDMAAAIFENGKTQRPGVCNALETLLIHREVAGDFFPKLREIAEAHGVVIHGDSATLAEFPQAKPVTEEDFANEFLDYAIAVKVVDGLDEAVEHIGRYSSGHSEVIVTEDIAAAEEFTQRVDAAVVYVNASSRFTDGGCFGYGMEMGISTQKLHVRGPFGAQHLVTTKYIVTGRGQIRS
ncbi:MAG: glutamate-5-semialdehyde dehydrogenase [Tissierellia bacterium]|nr:glutamate-5-semialdehyde dehydrogenase [Tissierellia bacterium]